MLSGQLTDARLSKAGNRPYTVNLGLVAGEEGVGGPKPDLTYVGSYFWNRNGAALNTR